MLLYHCVQRIFMPKVALFVPCYINDFYPQVALSTLQLLQKQGFEVVYPANQTCCGQPFLNNGLRDEVVSLAEHFYDKFASFDYVVAPSSSCISTIKHHYHDILPKEKADDITPKVYELCEFLYDVVGVDKLKIDSAFAHRVGLHNSCHSIRELSLGSASELNIPHFSKIKEILQKVKDIEVLEPSRDECCGFGGTFSIQEPEISTIMGKDRIADHKSNDVEFITGVDMSCLMHMDSIAKRDKEDITFIHIAQILNGDTDV